ncbi:THO complex subunit 3-like [Corticium candelabrum]|uniref:THO complex subunit 3-like n=1 Tax=Corticium candelabrum TaxID=121492 RepID=UPI002E304A5A|nr:THO complex subunit 3-like [Corticium candelabrum]
MSIEVDINTHVILSHDTNYSKHSHFLAETKLYFQKNNKTRDFQAHESKAHSVGWSCDGRKLASGSTDKTVSVFSLDKHNLSRIFNYKGHTDHVDQLSWHPSHPDCLVLASEDKTVRVWDSRTPKCAQCIITKGDNINICWSPDSNTIAVGNKEDLITWIDRVIREHTRCEPRCNLAMRWML